MMSQFRNRFVIKRSNDAGEIVIEWKSLEVRREMIRHKWENIVHKWENILSLCKHERFRIDLWLRNKTVTATVKRRHCLSLSCTRVSINEYVKKSLWASERTSEQTTICFHLSCSLRTDARIMKLVWRTSGRFIRIKDRIDCYIDAVDRYSIKIQSGDCRIKIKWLVVTKLHLIKTDQN